MVDSGTNSVAGPDCRSSCDRDGGRTPLHRQIEASIRERDPRGRLPAGVALPPTRALAADLGVSRGVVVEAYAAARRRGLPDQPQRRLHPGRVGGGEPRRRRHRPGRRHGRPAVRSTSATAAPTCRTSRAPPGCARCAGSSPRRPTSGFGYLDGRGVPELRSALADLPQPGPRHRRRRPTTIVITNGYAQAIALLSQVLAARGREAARASRTRPPTTTPRPVAHALGLDVVGVPVGDDGIRVDALDGAGRRRPHPHPVAPVADRRRALARGAGRGARAGRSAPARW